MLERLRRNWDAFGRTDPLWSILTLPGTERGHWDVEAFFETGRVEVRRVLAYLDEVAGPIGRGRALDFGCGVGRVTQALGAHYAQVDGVDIAESMIELARRSNRSGRRCRYHVHAADDLSLFASGTFDLVYCSYVLSTAPTCSNTSSPSTPSATCASSCGFSHRAAWPRSRSSPIRYRAPPYRWPRARTAPRSGSSPTGS